MYENSTKVPINQADLISTSLRFKSNKARIVAKQVSSPFYKPEQQDLHEFEFKPQLNSTAIISEETDQKIGTYSSRDLFSSSLVDDSSSIFTKPNTENDLYICVVNYKAMLDGDLSIKFSQQLKLICQNYDFSLVEDVSTRQHGFVPNYCIIPSKKFVSDFQN